MAAPSRPRPLAETVALVALAVVVAVGLAYLLRFALSPSRPIRGRASFGRPSEDDSDDTAASSDQATETTARPPAAEEATVEEATVEEATAAGATVEEATVEEATVEEATVEEATAAEPEAEPQPQAPTRPRRRLRGLLGWLIYLGVILGAIVLGPTALGWALGSEYPMATISSGSMWPALKEGDVVLLKGADSIDDVKVGDIIAFRHVDGFAIHRIARIEGEQITTRGDANTREDEPIQIEAVIGKVPTIAGTTARIPYLGNISFLLAPLMNSTADPGQPPQTATEGADLPSGEPEPVSPRGGP